MKSKYRLAAALLALIILVGGCATAPEKSSVAPSSSVDAADGKPYKFALIAPITGNNAQYGQAYKNALEILTEQVNANGGMQGAELIVEYYEDKNDPTEAVNIANKLLENDDILGVVGSQTSTPSLAIAPILQKAGITLISPQASHADFTNVGNYIFRFAPLLSKMVPKYANYGVEKYGTQIPGMIYPNTDWGLNFYELLRDRFAELGIELKAETYISGSTADYSPLISKMQNYGIDLFYCIAPYADAAQLLIKADQLGLDVPIICDSVINTPEFLSLTGDLSNGIVFFNTFRDDNPDPNYQTLKKLYEEKTQNQTDIYVVNAYDCLWVLVEAAKAVGHNRAAIRDYIAALDGFQGVSGEISIDANGDREQAFYVIEIRNGTFVYKENY